MVLVAVNSVNRTVPSCCIVMVLVAVNNHFMASACRRQHAILLCYRSKMSRNFCSSLPKFGFYRQIFIEVCSTKFNKNPSCGIGADTCHRRAGVRRNMMKLIDAFRENADASENVIFVVPSIMLYSSEISPTRCNNCVFILRIGFTLYVSGDNLIHHQEYICCIWPQVSRLT